MEQKDRAQQEPGLQDTTAPSETLSEEEAERTCRFKDRVRQAIRLGLVKQLPSASPAKAPEISEEEAEKICRFKDRVRQAIEIGTVKRVSPARPRNPDLTN
jgi:hypothetical protein